MLDEDQALLEHWEGAPPDSDNQNYKTIKDDTACSDNNASSSYCNSSPKSLQGQDTALCPLSIYLEKGCSCSGSCRNMECPCAHGGVMCRTGFQCLCINCDNPMNILREFKLNFHIARVDDCLMQKLYNYKMEDLQYLMTSNVVLPCCNSTSELQYIVPSTVSCSSCGSAVSYSWCTNRIHLQTVYPRNHCLVCCSCKPALHTHCQTCRKCTSSVNQGTCSECGTAKMFSV
ncbi:hypothetical protein SK128_025341 [Halocaridina rubra]|uniref:Tesmin/TSO1-like CXC domain-containing protein n=1 Tax=Halocaridina rubra TaxID=373956 RepID=A0AAN9ADT3_HALRR